MDKPLKRKLTSAALFAILIASILARLDVLLDVLRVLMLAIILALLLTPLCSYLECRRFRPQQAALLSVLFLIFILLIFVSILIPYIAARTAALFRKAAPVFFEFVKKADALAQYTGVGLQQMTSLVQQFTSVAASWTTAIAQGGMSLLRFTATLLLSVVIAYHLLRERNIFFSHALLLIPLQSRNAFLSGIQSCKNALSGYISGIFKTSAFVSVATYLGLLLLGVQDAFLLSLFSGVLEILPYIGPILAALPVLLVTLPQGMLQAGGSILLLVIVQQLESNLVGPYFTASSTSLHPLASLLCVFLSGTLFGIPGILMGIPAFIVCRSLYQTFQQYKTVMNL